MHVDIKPFTEDSNHIDINTLHKDSNTWSSLFYGNPKLIPRNKLETTNFSMLFEIIGIVWTFFINMVPEYMH